MRKMMLIICILIASLHSFAQEKVKQGFGFGALPAVSFDSDLGFQYGAIVNLFHYGDGSNYPKYDHSLYMEWSRCTKGSGINRIMYDTEKLIPGIRTTVDVTYYTDQMLSFYGFNGYQSDFQKSRSRSFYSHERNMFRAKADFQGNFGDSDFGWVGGYTFYNFDIDTVDIEKLELAPNPGGSLYQRYVKHGLIGSDEKNGGSINYLKLGLKYDSRDQRAFASKGIWTEALVQIAPDFINAMPHAKFALIHRQYFGLTKDMVLAYRLNYQATIGKGKVPYYAQPLLITSFLTAADNQGLGGKRSLRGVLRNRVIGDAVAFGNFEFRYKFLKFEAFKQNFYLGTNIFFDSGIILKPIEIEGYNTMSVADKNDLFLKDYESGKLHSSAGIGLKIGWNENFVISVDYGKAFNEQDGDTGMYINLNYMF
jgi:outer membrane protein assembly factor BamA